MFTSELTQYIRDKKNQKVGIISAFKIDATNLENFDGEKCKKPFVVIVHSKARDKVDKFDFEFGKEILYNKLYYVLSSLNPYIPKREKFVFQKPSRETVKYYNQMEERCKRYFKDCEKIIKFIDMFEYNIEEFQNNDETED